MSVPTTPGEGRLPLRRPPDGRMVAGVAAGLGAHLAVRVGVLRWVFVVGTAVLGAGTVLYLWLWLTVPPGDPRAAAPVHQARLAPRLRTVSLSAGARDVALAVILLLTAALLLLWRADVVLPASWLVPGLIVAAGAALAWGQLAQVQQSGDARRG
ncbi:PspC domain-containing protein, partial [Georgenia sp. 10Sc9-8]|nr:PspC domain-containing protein [Georgenia halotolerans]